MKIILDKTARSSSLEEDDSSSLQQEEGRTSPGEGTTPLLHEPGDTEQDQAPRRNDGERKNVAVSSASVYSDIKVDERDGTNFVGIEEFLKNAGPDDFLFEEEIEEGQGESAVEYLGEREKVGSTSDTFCEQLFPSESKPEPENVKESPMKLELSSKLQLENYEAVISFMDTYSAQRYFWTKRSDGKVNKLKNLPREVLGKCPKNYIHYQCSASGKPKPTGRGIRKNQSYLQKECTFFAKFKFDRKSHGYVCYEWNSAHSGHELTEVAWKLHPRGKSLTKVEADKVRHYINDMQCKKRDVKKQIVKECGKFVTRHDLYNAQAKEQRESGLSDLQITLNTLVNAKLSDSEATLTYIYTNLSEEIESVVHKEDDTRVLKGLFWQSGRMKENLLKFGQTLCIDGTYNLTNRQYILFPFLVKDSNLNSRCVA